MANTTSSTLSADLQTYFSKKLQVQAKYKTVLDQFGYTENIPAQSSKTISFTQYADLAVATTPLTEGTPPTNTALSSTPTTATISQIGAYVTLTDLASLTVKHPVTQKTTELLGVQGARSYDRLINATVVAGTNVIYAGAVAGRTSLAAGNVLTFLEVRKAVSLLRNNGATEFDDGNFVLVVDPSVETDLMTDTTFQNTVYRQAIPAKQNELYKGTITIFGGVTVVRSNNIPTIASTVTVHTSYVFGQNSYAVTDLQSMQMYTEGPGTVADPLHQIMTMGWKTGFASVILNNNFMVRLESASAY
ncbi:MAG TPA: N4-gp56 family major capsid protein [Candidatus Saccharimonadales bacterium]|jgi:N4-gp56 family major capsid protein|nr:N4-gp56 family major capsid protein [Candidatus Saccharimonadales bacterium]